MHGGSKSEGRRSKSEGKARDRKRKKPDDDDEDENDGEDTSRALTPYALTHSVSEPDLLQGRSREMENSKKDERKRDSRAKIK